MDNLLIQTLIICLFAGVALFALTRSPFDAEIKLWGRWIIILIFIIALAVQVIMPLLRSLG